MSYAYIIICLHIYICIYETCAWTPSNVFLSEVVVEIIVVQVQVETARGVYSSSTLIGVSACTGLFCCSDCWPASTMPIATLGPGTSHQTRPGSCMLTAGPREPAVNNSILSEASLILSRATQSKASDGQAEQRTPQVVLLTAGPHEPAVNNSILSEAKQCFLSKIVAESLLYNLK